VTEHADRPAPIGPVDAAQVPRFAGPATFARLPRLDQVSSCDVAVVGVPFDSGVTYRPGARFGPAAVREASRLLRPYHPGLDVEPFATQQVADAGDIACNPFDIEAAIASVEAGADELLGSGAKLLTIGGDHTIALPLLRSVSRRHGPVALLHFDAHLDTWDTYFGARYTHGTPFRRASEEGLLDTTALSHVGIRGPLYGRNDLDDDVRLGFDIDVLDPAHAPGTGTPEAGGLTSRELLAILRGLAGCQIVAADVVEVSPPYDHAELTTVAASHVSYDLISLMSVAGDVAAVTRSDQHVLVDEAVRQ
jgi:agmatinase